MKKLFVLLILTSSLLGIGKNCYAQLFDEPVCIGHELDGTLTIRAWGEGRNRADAREQAKKNAIYAVLFNGVRIGNDGYEARPLVPEVNARERYRDYFDIFFMDGGAYKTYVSIADRRLGSTKKVKSNINQVKYGFTVRVMVPQLRRRLIDDGVLKTN
jgi:hypothetical protein